MTQSESAKDSGHNLVFTSLPHVIIQNQGVVVLAVERSGRNNISIVSDWRSNDGKIIARINKDGYVINRNNTLEIRKDAHSLDVVDLYGRDILNLDYINPTTIVVKGPNIGLNPNFQNLCITDSLGPDISMN